jgi:oligoendopeptidase F
VVCAELLELVAVVENNVRRALRLSLTLFLTIALVLSSCAKVETLEPFDPLDPFVPQAVVREEVHFDDLPYYLPEAEELRAVYQNFVRDMRAAESAEEQVALIDSFDRAIRKYSDMYAISQIRFYQSISDETQAEYEYFVQLFVDIADDANEANATIVNSEFIRSLAYYYGEHVIERLRKSVREYSSAIVELYRQAAELESQHTRIYNEGMSNILYNGKTYTYFELLYMEREETNTSVRREMRKIRESSYNRFISESSSIFSDLAKTRASIAQQTGYDSYAEYVYSKTSVTLREVNEFINICKEVIVPIHKDLPSIRYMNLLEEEHPERVYELAVQALRKMFDEMGPMIDYLERNGFVDELPRSDKDAMSFCYALKGVQIPFIFISTSDPRTIIHEFGHAFEFYEQPFADIDSRYHATSEVHEVSATVLEALALSQFDLIYGDISNDAKLQQIGELVYFLMVNARRAEFDIHLYEKPDMTTANRNALFKRLSLEYGLPAYDWQSVPHFFQAPMYQINYAFANVVALETLLIMEDDLPRAKESYLAFVRDSMQPNLVARLENAGFSNPFDIKTLERITEYIERILTGDMSEAA